MQSKRYQSADAKWPAFSTGRGQNYTAQQAGIRWRFFACLHVGNGLSGARAGGL